VFCAFEAQVPENVIHKMQHLLVEEIKICCFFKIILVLAPGKDCITARRQVMANTSTLLTLRLLLSKVRPPRPRPWDARWHSKDQGKVRADGHVKSVIEEIPKDWRVGPDPVLCFSFGRKKVDRTAKARVLRQATVQNSKVSNGIVQVWIVLVA
jgi:hypothetical protein